MTWIVLELYANVVPQKGVKDDDMDGCLQSFMGMFDDDKEGD